MSVVLRETPLFLAGVAWRGFVLLLVAHGVVWALGRASGATRDLVWRAAFAGLLALPVVGAVLPAWHLPLPVAAVLDRVGANLPDARGTVEPGTSVAHGIADSPDPWTEPGGRGGAAGAPAIRTGRAGLEAEGSGIDGHEPVVAPDGWDTRWAGREIRAGPVGRWWIVGTVVSGLWLAGMLAFLAGLGLRHLRAVAVARTSKPLVHEGWDGDLRAVMRRLGLTHPPGLRITRWVAVPMVVGVRHPCVLLPADAGGWRSERRRMVLLHEVAHVGRADLLAKLLVDVTCALHWFDPLVWMARSRSAVAREQACDDVVLGAGVGGRLYALELLGFARRLGPEAGSAGACPGMARRSGLERRLRALLLPDRRRGVPGGPVRAATLLGLFALGWPLATATVSTPPARPPVGVGGAPGAGAVWPEILRTAPDPEVRAQAAWALGESGAAGAETALVEALSDPAPEVREQAAWALGEIGAVTAGGALISLLDDGAPGVRHQVAWALGELRVEASGPDLMDALGDPHWNVRAQAAWALGEMGRTSARNALVRLLSDDADPRVRAQARQALGELDDVTTVRGRR